MQQGILRHLTGLALLLSLWAGTDSAVAGEPPENFRRENLVAWCIVPFDARERTPRQRAEMLGRLGLKRVAYDWRQQHVSQFEEEILAYADPGVELFAFWNGHDGAFALFEKYGLRPQIWKTVPSPGGKTTEERVRNAVEKLMPLVEKTAAEGLELGLYNHGAWGGLPHNMVAICEALREAGHEHVGLVYNFHHAHPRIAWFSADLELMMPYLFCVNLNGMADPGRNDVSKSDQKIRPIGSGDHEEEMILTLIERGYEGPVGILGHVKFRDVEEVLRENIEGLERILARAK
ncbi:MAG: TIM barrel protein [Verrucomicrobiales bacterium]